MAQPLLFRSIIYLAAALLQMSAQLLLARSASAEDTPPFSQRISVVLRVLDGNLLERVTIRELKIGSPSMVQPLSTVNLPINEHFAAFESLDAETIKADGRRVPVDESKILLSQLPNAAQMGIFQADIKQRTIVYPDVESGDTLRYVYKVSDIRKALPGGFDWSNFVDPTFRFESYVISLDAPADLKVRVTSEGFRQSVELGSGRARYTWTMEPLAYRAAEPGSVGPMERGPHIIISSRSSSDEIAKVFFEQNDAKAAPSGEVRQLADKITSGMTGRRAQATAIHDWVSANVRYFTVWLNSGGFVAHAADEILANKFGDCKDHVTLMRALLRAKGIEADYALINVGNGSYRDLGTNYPCCNHVILYVPEFDAYADPTSRTSGFGNPPPSERGQIVYRTGPTGVTKTRIPLATADASRFELKSDVTMRPDGTPVGTAVWTGYGDAAYALRNQMVAVEASGPDETAKRMLSAANWRGTGRIEPRPASDHAEPYVVKTSFDLGNVFFGKGNGRNDNGLPLGPVLLNSPWTALKNYLDKGYSYDIPWSAGQYDLTIDITLPPGVELKSLPKPIDVAAGNTRFKASYSRNGSIVRIERHWRDDSNKRTLSQADIKAMAPVVNAASAEIRNHLQFNVAAGETKTD